MMWSGPLQIGQRTNSHSTSRSCSRGYRTLSHDGGSNLGHLSEFHLFPDVSLGIFTSLNGVDGSDDIDGQYSMRDHIHMYVGKCEKWMTCATNSKVKTDSREKSGFFLNRPCWCSDFLPKLIPSRRHGVHDKMRLSLSVEFARAQVASR